MTTFTLVRKQSLDLWPVAYLGVGDTKGPERKSGGSRNALALMLYGTVPVTPAALALKVQITRRLFIVHRLAVNVKHKP